MAPQLHSLSPEDNLLSSVPDWHRAADLRRSPDPWPVLLPLDDEAVQSRRQDRISVGSCRRHSLASNVLQTLLNLQVSGTRTFPDYRVSLGQSFL